MMNLRKAKKHERIDIYNKLKIKIKELMLRNPAIQTSEIVAKTDCSEYQVLRAYISVKRELFARASKNR